MTLLLLISKIIDYVYSQAHMETFLMRAFYEHINKSIQHISISLILEQLFSVFAIHTLRNESVDFIRVSDVL